jgi:hypothetical protein
VGNLSLVIHQPIIDLNQVPPKHHYTLFQGRLNAQHNIHFWMAIPFWNMIRSDILDAVLYYRTFTTM